MLSELLPKSHNHHRSLSLFGPILDDFDDWLVARGYCFLTRQCYILRRTAHVLSAFASGLALILAHVECDEKSNEIPAVQKLIAELGLPGSLLTVDAMHCQKKPSKRPLAPVST